MTNGILEPFEPWPRLGLMHHKTREGLSRGGELPQSVTSPNYAESVEPSYANTLICPMLDLPRVTLISPRQLLILQTAWRIRRSRSGR